MATLLDSTKNAMHGFYKQMMETVVPVNTKSEFLEKGTLTPDEFLQAGNKLVNQCPTWTWEQGDKTKKKDHLDSQKQYLQTRNVPCLARVASLLQNANEEVVENGEWLAMDDQGSKELADQIADIDLDSMQEIGATTSENGNANKVENTGNADENNSNINSNGNLNGNSNGKNSNQGMINIVEHSAFNDENIENHNDANGATNMGENNTTKQNEPIDDIDDLSDSYEEIPDIDSFNDDDNVVPKAKVSQNGNDGNQDSTQKQADNANNTGNDGNEIEEKKMDDNSNQPMFKLKQEDDNIMRTRTYDVSITFDLYYKVPRIWLRGYDENGDPLTASQIFEDISADHAHKTVTVEAHPHMNGVICAGIHPCRHSAVMKRFMDRLEESGKALSVDQYMFLFLKFMSAVIPTIEYDWTESVDG